MCVVSMIGDFYNDKWRRDYGQSWPVTPAFLTPTVSREEFDALTKDVLDMKELLKRAKLYDERTHQPDCEMEEKVALLKHVAKLVGVNLDDVFGHETPKAP